MGAVQPSAEEASVATEDTVLPGFGVESLDGPATQASVLGRALDHVRRGR